MLFCTIFVTKFIDPLGFSPGLAGKWHMLGHRLIPERTRWACGQNFGLPNEQLFLSCFSTNTRAFSCLNKYGKH